ncbi:MAG TPA: sulfotransferase [Gammaproteobacteria bacterium]|nr:sulfotransferase [Gammaproteobacteria bacterium]
MSVRVIGAGLGRTGTTSLRQALEHLLDGPCYQMPDVYRNPAHVALWHDAVRGEMPEWNDLFAGCAAVVDWPAASFWRELSNAYPDALIVLSVREPESWWRSANETIFSVLQNSTNEPWRVMVTDLFASRFTGSFSDKSACIAAFERHNAEVREGVPGDRLLEWQPSDGWRPLCNALDLPIPDRPFPHANTTKEFQARSGQ